jgi:hypothetical protein
MYISMSLESEMIDELNTTELEDDSQKFTFKLLDRLGNPLTPQQVQVFNIQEGHDLYLTPHFFESVMQQKECIRYNPYKGDTFALGIMVLKCGLMVDVGDLYNVETGQFSYELLEEMKAEFVNIFNDAILTELLNLLLEVDDSKRLSPKGIQQKMDFILNRLSERPEEFKTLENIPDQESKKSEKKIYSESETEESGESETEESVSQESKEETKDEIKQDKSEEGTLIEEGQNQPENEEYEEILVEEEMEGNDKKLDSDQLRELAVDREESPKDEEMEVNMSMDEELSQEKVESDKDDTQKYGEFMDVENSATKENKEEESGNEDKVENEQEKDSVDDMVNKIDDVVDNVEDIGEGKESEGDVVVENNEGDQVQSEIETEDKNEVEGEGEVEETNIGDEENIENDYEDEGEDQIEKEKNIETENKVDPENELENEENIENEEKVENEENIENEENVENEENIEKEESVENDKNIENEENVENEDIENSKEPENLENLDKSEDEEIKQETESNVEKETEIENVDSNKQEPETENLDEEPQNIDTKNDEENLDDEEFTKMEFEEEKDDEPENEQEIVNSDQKEIESEKETEKEVLQEDNKDQNDNIENENFEKIEFEEVPINNQEDLDNEGMDDDEQEFKMQFNLKMKQAEVQNEDVEDQKPEDIVETFDNVDFDEKRVDVNLTGSVSEKEEEEVQEINLLNEDDNEEEPEMILKEANIQKRVIMDEPQEFVEEIIQIGDNKEESLMEEPSESDVEINLEEHDIMNTVPQKSRFNEDNQEEEEVVHEEMLVINKNNDSDDDLEEPSDEELVQGGQMVEETQKEEVEEIELDNEDNKDQDEEFKAAVEPEEVDNLENSQDIVRMDTSGNVVLISGSDSKKLLLEEVNDEQESQNEDVQEIELPENKDESPENDFEEIVFEEETDFATGFDPRIHSKEEEKDVEPEEVVEIEMNDEKPESVDVEKEESLVEVEIKEESEKEESEKEDIEKEESLVEVEIKQGSEKEDSVIEVELKEESEKEDNEPVEMDLENEEIEQEIQPQSEKDTSEVEEIPIQEVREVEIPIDDQVSQNESLDDSVNELNIEQKSNASVEIEEDNEDPENDKIHQEYNKTPEEEDIIYKVKASLKEMILNEEEVTNPYGLIQSEVKAEQIELKDPNEPDVKFDPSQGQYNVEMTLPEEPKLLNEQAQFVRPSSQTVLEMRNKVSSKDEIYQENVPLSNDNQDYIDNMQRYYQSKYQENIDKNEQPAEEVISKYQEYQKITANLGNKPTVVTSSNYTSNVGPTQETPFNGQYSTNPPYSEVTEIQRIKDRYFSKPLANEVVQNVQMNTVQPIQAEIKTATQILKSMTAQANQQPEEQPVYVRNEVVANPPQFQSFNQNVQPVMTNLEPQLTFNKKVKPVSTVIANHVENKPVMVVNPQDTFHTPKRISFTRTPLSTGVVVNKDSGILGEELPLSSIFKNISRLKQSVQVFRNPESNNKRIVLNNSSRFQRISQLGTTEKNTNSLWKSSDYRSVPIKKKQMYSQTRSPITKHDLMGRQHSVSAKTNYPRYSRIKRISAQHETNPKINISTKPNIESTFKDSVSTPNNYLIQSNLKTPTDSKYEAVSSNYVNKVESTWNREKPVKSSEKRTYIERRSEVKPTQYMSERTKAFTESKVINRKTSYNETNSSTKRVVTYLKTPSGSSNAPQNSLPWTETQTNSFQPAESKVLANSLYPQTNQQERYSNGIGNKYQSNDEYNFSSFQTTQRPNVEYSTQIPKESIVLSRQRNPQMEVRYSEVKTTSFDSTPVKSKSIILLT